MAPSRHSGSSRGSDARQRQAILQAREMIEKIARRDVNEAETCHHVKWVFTEVLGYDAYRHLTHEHAVKGVGATDHVDLAINIDEGDRTKPVMLVELKRVGAQLASRHIKQAANYAIHTGCEWIILTNGRAWMLFHIEFGQPPQPKLVQRWNLLEDDLEVLAKRFRLISLESVEKGGLDEYWRTRRVLNPRNLLNAIFSHSSLQALRRELRVSTDVLLPVEDIIGGLRRLLNESALTTLETIEITFPDDDGKPALSRSKGEQRDTSLKSLIERGILKPPVSLFADYKGTRLTATLLADGSIEFGGESFDSPSTAGSAARATVLGRRAATNGWTFWSYTDAEGESRTLDHARRQVPPGGGGGGAT